MKTKTSAKSSSAKSAPKGSKLASIKGAVTKAIFGKKGAAPQKPSQKDAKSNGKAAVAKSAAVPKAPAKGAAASAAKAAPAKAEKGKAAAPVAGAKATAGKTAGGKTAGGKAASAVTKVATRASVRATADEICREVACEALSTSGGYCRLHYIKNWKKIKRKELILKEGKLNQYIEELVAKYPDKYIEAIRQDLAEDKAFAKVIYDLDLDESVDEFEGEGENVDALIDNIKRDFDDEGESF